jgi:hypothetical protein
MVISPITIDLGRKQLTACTVTKEPETLTITFEVKLLNFNCLDGRGGVHGGGVHGGRRISGSVDGRIGSFE